MDANGAGGDELRAIAAGLREQAGLLVQRAEQIERVVDHEADGSGTEGRERELAPLALPETDDEAGARIVALDLASRKVSRVEASTILKEKFPDVDGDDLLDRFY